MKLKWMRFGFLTISSPDGKRSPPESFAFVVFYSLFDHLNMGVQLSSLKVTGQSISWYYFHYPPRQGYPGDPSPVPPLAPHTHQKTDTKNGERSHSANLYNHSKFAIFNDRSQLLDSIITLWSSSFWEQPGCVSNDQSSQQRRLHCSLSVRTGLSVPPVSVCMDCHNSNCPNSR